MIQTMYRAFSQRKMWLMAAAAALLLAQGCSNGAAPESSAVEPRVFIIAPAGGSTVTSPVLVEFGIEGFAVAPAGTQDAGTGHHHLLINTPLPALDQPIPADDNHVHFGKGQTSAELDLAPGQYTLQMLLGDGNHVPHDPALISEPITITVSE